jgi:hypothetical protein
LDRARRSHLKRVSSVTHAARPGLRYLGTSEVVGIRERTGAGSTTQAHAADTSQLGGDVLVDPAGTVRFLHIGSGPADRPSVAEILQARQSAPTPPQ